MLAVLNCLAGTHTCICLYPQEQSSGYHARYHRAIKKKNSSWKPDLSESPSPVLQGAVEFREIITCLCLKVKLEKRWWKAERWFSQHFPIPSGSRFMSEANGAAAMVFRGFQEPDRITRGLYQEPPHRRWCWERVIAVVLVVTLCPTFWRPPRL